VPVSRPVSWKHPLGVFVSATCGQNHRPSRSAVGATRHVPSSGPESGGRAGHTESTTTGFHRSWALPAGRTGHRGRDGSVPLAPETSPAVGAGVAQVARPESASERSVPGDEPRRLDVEASGAPRGRPGRSRARRRNDRPRCPRPLRIVRVSDPPANFTANRVRASPVVRPLPAFRRFRAGPRRSPGCRACSGGRLAPQRPQSTWIVGKGEAQ
jgi:hypothetical protein